VIDINIIEQIFSDAAAAQINRLKMSFEVWVSTKCIADLSKRPWN